MNKKNEALDQEKEQLFLTYQKKIEELQSKVLDNSNNNSTEDESAGGGLIYLTIQIHYIQILILLKIYLIEK